LAEKKEKKKGKEVPKGSEHKKIKTTGERETIPRGGKGGRGLAR